jgi:hypothetical protein
VKKRTHGHVLNSEEIYSQVSVDNEASRGISIKDPTDVSFVLERKINESGGSSPGKFGLFTIALVMCLACFSSFFSPIASPGGNDSSPKASISTHPGING